MFINAKTIKILIHIYSPSVVVKYRGYSLPKIQPLKLDNAYFVSTKHISKNLIVDPRVTYCTGIKHFDYLDLIK
jgi:hypothetical protein